MSIKPGPCALHVPFIHCLEQPPYWQEDVIPKLEDTPAYLLRGALKNYQDSLH